MLFELVVHSALLGSTLLAPGVVEGPLEPPVCKLGEERVYSFEVASGDTMEKVFDQVGAGPWSADQAKRAIKKYYDTSWLAPGTRLDIGMSRAGVPRWFRFRPNLTAGVCAVRQNREQWQVLRLDIPIDRDIDVVSIDAEPNLAQAIEDLGEDPQLLEMIEQLFPTAKIDQIQLLVEKLSVEGEFLAYTRILAAEAIAGGKPMRAFLYTFKDGRGGYYTDNAVPLHEIALYHPVPNALKSSSYGLRRHPIRHIKRHHKGVDYAAPMDTAVHAAADGLVVEAHYYGPLGRMVVIDHGSGLITRYAHLNRYAPGIRAGVHVKRGEPIGRIGTSGLSTGAHLHFETLIGDNHVNPTRVTTPPAPAIPDELMADFAQHVATLIKQLDLHQSSSPGA